MHRPSDSWVRRRSTAQRRAAANQDRLRVVRSNAAPTVLTHPGGSPKGSPPRGHLRIVPKVEEVVSAPPPAPAPPPPPVEAKVLEERVEVVIFDEVVPEGAQEAPDAPAFYEALTRPEKTSARNRKKELRKRRSRKPSGGSSELVHV